MENDLRKISTEQIQGLLRCIKSRNSTPVYFARYVARLTPEKASTVLRWLGAKEPIEVTCVTLGAMLYVVRAGKHNKYPKEI